MPVSSVITSRDGLLFHCDTSSFIEWSLFFFGEYEPTTTDLLAHLIRPGATCVDAGANVGLMTLTMARAAGKTGQVFAFEPNPPVADRLEANIHLNGLTNVKVERVCLGAAPGQVEFFVPRAGISNVGQSSLYLSHHPRLSERDLVKHSVPMIRLDDYIASINPPSLDLIKIDVEGAEAQLLEGASKSIERWHPTIVFEANAVSAGLGSTTIGDLLAVFEGHGYELFMEGAGGRLLTFTAEEKHRAETRPDYQTNLIARYGPRPHGQD